MARLVSTTVDKKILANVNVTFTDGTVNTKSLSVGDEVTGLRYVEDEQVKSVTGVISDIVLSFKGTPKADTSISAADHFAENTVVKKIVVDASEQYHSKLVEVDAFEIVEDEGVTDVKCVHVSADMIVTVTQTYTDGSSNVVELQAGDVLDNVIIMSPPDDIKGTFEVLYFLYTVKKEVINLTKVALKDVRSGKIYLQSFNTIISYGSEMEVAPVTNPTSLGSIAEAFTESNDVYAQLGTDVTIPPREDGKITTVFIQDGQNLVLDLNGHSINTSAYAFYMTGGTLEITGDGKITGNLTEKAYGMIQANGTAKVIMNGGVIDTTAGGTEDENNYLYGVVCFGDAVFEMNSGEINVVDAAAVSITNGTAESVGAQFIIGGDSVIKASNGPSVYLADNKSIILKDNAVAYGPVMARMGNVEIRDKAKVYGFPADKNVYGLGKLITESGCASTEGGIVALTGCYNSSLGNDLNILVESDTLVDAKLGAAVTVVPINTLYDQVVDVDIAASKSLKSETGYDGYKVFTRQELVDISTAAGKTIGEEKKHSTITIKMAGKVVYDSEATA